MLQLASYDIVFQEVPGEVTLALNLSACPNRCPGCHSPHLRDQVGESLDDGLLDGLLERYGGSVTCVAFMGGDGEPEEVNRLAARVKSYNPSEKPAPEVRITSKSADKTPKKVAWYSGRAEIPSEMNLDTLDFVKLGPYDPERGGLSSPDTTNQRFYRVEGPAGSRKMVDATSLFRKNR